MDAMDMIWMSLTSAKLRFTFPPFSSEKRVSTYVSYVMDRKKWELEKSRKRVK